MDGVGGGNHKVVILVLMLYCFTLVGCHCHLWLEEVMASLLKAKSSINRRFHVERKKTGVLQVFFFFPVSAKSRFLLVFLWLFDC